MNNYLARNKKAFTLLELIVVVVILGILAAIAVTSYVNVVATTNDKVTLSSLVSLSDQAAKTSLTQNELQAISKGASSGVVLTAAPGVSLTQCPTNPTFQQAIAAGGSAQSPLKIFNAAVSTSYGMVSDGTDFQTSTGNCIEVAAAVSPTGHCARVALNVAGSVVLQRVGVYGVCAAGSVVDEVNGLPIPGLDGALPVPTTTAPTTTVPPAPTTTVPPATTTTAPPATTTTTAPPAPARTTAYGYTSNYVVPASECSPMAVNDGNNQTPYTFFNATDATGTTDVALNLDQNNGTDLSNLTSAEQTDANLGLQGVSIASWFFDNKADPTLANAQAAAATLPQINGHSYTVVASTPSAPHPSTTPGVISFWTNGINFVITTITPGGHCVASSNDTFSNYGQPAEIATP